MLKLWKVAPSHEDLFIERYERLLGWSLKLTAHDRQLAEDLLHDVFVQFTLRRPDLTTIHDLEGYLFAMLRNSHVSYVRRVPYVRTTPLSMAEYDSLEIGLRATDVRDQIKVQDELRLICHYASLRKDTSKAGSVLILRFFHGYYPSEIAQILRSKLDTVRKWLQLARNEAKLYLESPDALGFIRETFGQVKPQVGFARTTEELLNDLRDVIFSSRNGDCFSLKELRELYSPTHSATIEGPALGHIVSCAQDLDQVNTLLDLPLLKDRYPTDMTGNDTKGGCGGGLGGGPGGPTRIGGGAGKGSIRRSLRRVKETFEHYPKELRIAVNGYVQVSQKISSDLMEQTLSLDLGEKIGFVEIFSEQWIRLFFINVDPPPDGAFEQQAHIAFSEGRSLKASLDFTGPCPNLQVVYHDPTLTTESGVESLENEVQTETVQSPTSKLQRPLVKDLGLVGRVNAVGVGLAHRAKDIGHWTLDLGLLLRPGVVTALVALLLTAVVLFVEFRRPPVPPDFAMSLLAQSATAEESIAARADQVLHRTINLEEKNAAGEPIARRRIEVWHSAERGVTARRIYDEQNRLVAGDWRRADGVQTLYAHGTKPQIQPSPDKRAAIALNFANAWQQDLTTQEFSALVKNAEALKVDEGASTYVLKYQTSNPEGLNHATLVLSRPDLHAIEQTFIVRQGSEERTYHYLETSFERRPTSAVAPAVFEPDAVLLSERLKAEGGRMKDARSPSPLPSSPVAPVASPALEMEVVRLLDQAGAFGGDQVSVSRTPEGALLVEGVLDTDQRKRELLTALVPVSRNPVVKIRIETQSEAIERQAKHKSDGSAGHITLSEVQITNKVPPAYAELRRYFGARGVSGDQSEREINAYVDSVLGHSMRARQQARALKQLAERFSQEELRMLDDESRAKWRAMILQHARGFQREAEGLHRKLEPVFSESVADERVSEINSDAELIKTIERLFALWASVDENLRQSFSITSSGEADNAVKRPQFWQSLNTAEALSGKIARQ